MLLFFYNQNNSALHDTIHKHWLNLYTLFLVTISVWPFLSVMSSYGQAGEGKSFCREFNEGSLPHFDTGTETIESWHSSSACFSISKRRSILVEHKERRYIRLQIKDLKRQSLTDLHSTCCLCVCLSWSSKNIDLQQRLILSVYCHRLILMLAEHYASVMFLKNE